jgi:hypothetical protein
MLDARNSLALLERAFLRVPMGGGRGGRTRASTSTRDPEMQ